MQVGDILRLSSPGAKDELASLLADALGELAELKQRNRELEDQAKGAKDALWEADAMLQLGLVPPPRIGHMVGTSRIGHMVGALDVAPADASASGVSDTDGEPDALCVCVDEPHALTDSDAEPLRLPDSVPLRIATRSSVSPALSIQPIGAA